MYVYAPSCTWRSMNSGVASASRTESGSSAHGQTHSTDLTSRVSYEVTQERGLPIAVWRVCDAACGMRSQLPSGAKAQPW